MKFINNTITMNSREIKELLEKYYLGETSSDEDREIKRYLDNDQTSSYRSEKAQFLFYQSTAKEVSRKLPHLDIEENKAPKPNKYISIQMYYRLAALLIISVGLGYIYLTYFRESMTELVTQTNTLDNATLPDGTHVWLGRHSTLRYPPVFDIATREVFLEGEAYFEVTEKPTQPFIVHASQTTTKVVGTAFNLRNYNKEEKVELSVYSGKVLFGAETKMELKHNEQSTYHKNNKELKRFAIKNANTLAWKDKTLVFENALLKDVFADLERYFSIKIEVRNKDLLKCHFNGNFKHPRLEEILGALSYSINLNYELENDVCLIIGQGCV